MHPGPVVTGMAQETVGSYGPERLKAYLEKIPLRRLADPVEISHLVLYLASDESTFRTGSEFVIDGGILARGPGPAPGHLAGQ